LPSEYVVGVARVSALVICAAMVGGCDCTTRGRTAAPMATGKTTVVKTTALPGTATRSTSVPGTPASTKTSAPTKISAPPPAPVPLTEPALLTPQPEPQCGFATDGRGLNDPQRLDYERQCYRHAEMIVRARLDLLQEAVRRNERASP
jgi:hypothetical protein